MNTQTQFSVEQHATVPNEGQTNMIILFPAPYGTLYIDNVGSYVVEDNHGKLEIKTAAGWWPMILHRDAPPESQRMMRQ